MNDLIKGAVRQKNITNKNQMPEWMKREQERASQKKVNILKESLNLNGEVRCSKFNLTKKRPAPNQILTIQFALETDRYRVIIILRPILLLLWT